MRYMCYTFIFLIGILFSIPVVSILLLTPWNGRTTIFGNVKWGRGNDHFSTPTKGYWQEFKWLCYRNPVNNLCARLSMPYQTPIITGNTKIIDQRESGFYRLTAGKAWELGYVRIYGKRCCRVRLGWKILGNKDGTCDYVLSIVPFMHWGN